MTNDFDPKDPKITAYALDELNSSEKADIEKLIQESDDAQRAVREIRMTAGLLSEEFQNESKPSLTEKHRQAIEQTLHQHNPQQNTISLASPNRNKNQSRRRVPAWMTACLLLVVASVWAFRSGLFESRQGSDTTIIADHDTSTLNRTGILPEDQLELKRSMMESSKSDFLKKDTDQNSEGQNADDHMKKQSLSMIPPSKSNLESKSKDRRVSTPPVKSESQNRFSGASRRRGSSNNTKSGQALKNKIRPESQKEQMGRQGIQKPSSVLSLLQDKRNRQQQHRSRPRRAFKNESYLGLKLLKESRKRSRFFGRQPGRLPSERKEISGVISGRKSSEKSKQGKQNKPFNSKNDKEADNKGVKFFKKQQELGKKQNHPVGKSKEKSKEIDDSNRAKDAKLTENEVKESLDVFVVENEFLSAMRYPNSSIPLEVTNSSSLIEISRYIEKGMLPPASSVRIEEMLNHFEYSDIPAIKTSLVDVVIESGFCPWNQNHTLVRVGIKVKNAKPNTTNPQIIARNVKLKIQFNPDKVGWHRLIGYDDTPLTLKELNESDDLVAGYSSIALYEIVPKNLLAKRGERRLNELLKNKYVAAPKLIDRLKHTNELLSVELSYTPVGESRIRSLNFPHVPTKGSIVSKEFQWASSVAMYGLLLRDSYYAGNANLEFVKKLAAGSRGNDKHGRRKQFLELVEKTIKLVNQQPRK